MENNYQPKIAIIIPTIYRDDLLMDAVESILENVDMNLCKIFIIDQNHPDTYSDRKRIFYATAASDFHTMQDQRIVVIPLGYDAGISYCRNEGVKWAERYKIPYCLISADSIAFNKSMKNLDKALLQFGQYDLLGFKLNGRIPWEGWLNLVEGQHFELEYIDTSKCAECYNKMIIWKCNIVKNFFLARTNSLAKVRWEDDLKMREHEIFFWKYFKAGYKVGYTKFLNGDKIGDETKLDDSKYAKLRRIRMVECKEILFKKLGIKKWMVYKNRPPKGE